MLLACTTQVYDGCLYDGRLKVPKYPGPLQWCEPRVPQGPPLTVSSAPGGRHSYEYRDALPAALFRDKLVERYGRRGEQTRFAEVFSVSEYGAPLTPEREAELFPF